MKKFFSYSLMLLLAVVLGSSVAMADSHADARIYIPERFQLEGDEVYNVPVYMDADGADINTFQYRITISKGFEVGTPFKGPRLDGWDGIVTFDQYGGTAISLLGKAISNEDNTAPIMYIPVSRKAGSTELSGSLELTEIEVCWVGEDGITIEANPKNFSSFASFNVVDTSISLDVANVNVTAGSTATVHVGLNNPDALTMAQMYVRVPEGISLSNFVLADRVKSTGAEIVASPYTDTEYSIVIVNFNDISDSFPGNSGEIFSFDVTAASDFVSGDILLYDIYFTNKAAELISINDVEIPLDGTTGINSVVAGDSQVKYYNLNGIEVAPTPGNIYIKVANGKATKVLVK